MLRRGVRSSVEKGSRLKVHALAHALGILSLICIIFYALFVWFGGYDGIYVARQYPITFDFNDWTFIFGLVQSYVLGYVAGWIFAKIYNRTS